MSESRFQRYFYIIVFMYEYMKIFGCFFFIFQKSLIFKSFEITSRTVVRVSEVANGSRFYLTIIFKTKLIAFISFFTLSLKYLMEIDIFLRKNDEGCLFYVFNFNDIHTLSDSLVVCSTFL